MNKQNYEYDLQYLRDCCCLWPIGENYKCTVLLKECHRFHKCLNSLQLQTQRPCWWSANEWMCYRVVHRGLFILFSSSCFHWFVWQWRWESMTSAIEVWFNSRCAWCVDTVAIRSMSLSVSHGRTDRRAPVTVNRNEMQLRIGIVVASNEQ